MAADLPDRKTHDPDAVAAQTFTTVRKGYEPDEVRAFLLAVASTMRDSKLRFEDMERRLVEVERRAADPKDLDEHAVTQLLGEETARVLETARKAAADIRSRAEKDAAEQEAAIAERDRITRESADEYAAGVRGSADEADRRIRADAERYSEEVRSAADAETTAQRAAADEYDERIRSAADTEIAGLRSTAAADAERIRSEAASVLTERTAEAEVAASAILSEADGYSTRVRADADRYSEATRAAADSYRSDVQSSADAYKADAVAEGDRLRQEAIDEARRTREEAEAAAHASAEASDQAAEAALDAAREQGRQMVEEARTYRERVIADLADRRRIARGQLDTIAATRDALAVSLSDVAAGLSSSQRMLDGLEIDSSLLGDVSADRAALEAHDASRPLLAEPNASVEPAVDGEPGDPDIEAADDLADRPGGAAQDPAEDQHSSDADADADADAADSTDAADSADEADVEPDTGAAEPVDADNTAVAADDQAEGGVSDALGVAVDVEEPVESIVDPDTDASSVADLDDRSAVVDVDLSAPVVDLTDERSTPGRTDDDPIDAGDSSATVEAAMTEADIANGEGEASIAAPVDKDSEQGASNGGGGGVGDGADGDHDMREGRIDQIFAKIRADRHEDPDPGGDGNSVAAVASIDTDVTVDQPEPESVIDTDPDTDLLDRRDAALEEVEKQLARRLKRVLADEQNETLDLLRRTKGTPSAESVLPAETDHQERYRSAALEDLSTAERIGAGFFGEAPTRRADVFDAAGDFASEILRQIRGQLVRALDDGGDEYELGDRIRSCYREWKTQRIADTARHYVMVAFSRGVAEAGNDGDRFRWLMDDGDQPCPDCDDNQLGGGVVKGEPFPTGDLCPPAHPGCRCLAVPVE